jgi:hypothetical protein
LRRSRSVMRGGSGLGNRLIFGTMKLSTTAMVSCSSEADTQVTTQSGVRFVHRYVGGGMGAAAACCSPATRHACQQLELWTTASLVQVCSIKSVWWSHASCCCTATHWEGWPCPDVCLDDLGGGGVADQVAAAIRPAGQHSGAGSQSCAVSTASARQLLRQSTMTGR